MAENKKNLYNLDELSDYKVASDYSDVRGWKVIDADQRTIGKVEGLLVNKKEERVVYLDIEVDKNLIEEGHEPYENPDHKGAHEYLNKEGENHLIIPVGLVDLDEEGKKVWTNEIGYDTFRKTKRYEKGSNIDRDYEVMVIKNYLPAETTDENIYPDERLYKRKEFQPSKRRK
jgi:sporulation protein YlmC with PRC-barrel domain